MVKLGFSVDNHFDVNRIDPDEAARRQAAYLLAHHYGVYINAGDSFNDFQKTLAYYHHLQQLVGAAVEIRFLAGNHDLVKGISYEESQRPIDPLYLHEQALAVGDNTVIIGNNGWYDYTLAPQDLQQTADFAQWKRAYWIDSAIDQPVTDAERMARVLTTTRQALAANAGKRVLYVTHFVPTPAAMYYSPEHQWWQMATGMMGSAKLGVMLEQAQVAAVVFGHLHRRQAPLKRGGTTYYHQPMGYGLKRLNEWQTADWFHEWKSTLVTLTA